MKTKYFSAGLFATTSTVAILIGLGQAALAQQATASGNIETVVVTGSRDQAADIKKQAPVILDIAPLEQVRSLPDANAAEALQRLPGISLESDSGAGRFVNIRGMDADLNGTTFDGVRMTASNPASPQSGGRAVAFDAFPTGILGGVEVIKSLTPEMDAGGGWVASSISSRVPSRKERNFWSTVLSEAASKACADRRSIRATSRSENASMTTRSR